MRLPRQRTSLTPGGLVDRLLDLLQVAPHVVTRQVDVVLEVSVVPDLQTLVPLVQRVDVLDEIRIPDHIRYGVRLDVRRLPRLLVHPLEILEVLLEGRPDVADHLLGLRLRVRMEDFLDEDRAYGEAQHVVRVLDAEPPLGLFATLGTHQGLAETLVSVSESLGEAAGEGPDGLPDDVVVEDAGTVVVRW